MGELAENTKTVYQELCNSYRAIDDFRMKLMGLLPLVTVGGIFILIADETKLKFAQKFFLPIGAFGILVAFGLFCYELYGVKKCHGLIQAGIRLEEGMHIENGQFRTRPLGFAGFINEPFASGVIYPAVLAAWIFVALLPEPAETVSGETIWGTAVVQTTWETAAAQTWAIRVFVGFFVLVLAWNLWLQREELMKIRWIRTVAKWITNLRSKLYGSLNRRESGDSVARLRELAEPAEARPGTHGVAGADEGPLSRPT